MSRPCPGAASCHRDRRPVAPTSRTPQHIDGNRQRKKTATRPPRHAAVKVGSGSIGSASFRITILLKNKVPKSGVLVAGAEEARLRDAEKFRKYAEDCVRIADQMNGKDRQALLAIAEAWEARAQDSERREKGSAS